MLDRHGIVHPEVVFAAPQGAGWLLKDAASCGGTRVRRWRAGLPVGATSYWQREIDGVPMSATFVANGARASCSASTASSFANPRPALRLRRRHRAGSRQRARPAQRDARAAPAGAGLRAARLGSLDFIARGDAALVLEVNARPPASAALYPRLGDGSPLRAHRRACGAGELPPAPAPAPTVRGIETVFARRSIALSRTAAASIAERPDTHDLPRAGQRFDRGDPLCSVSASGSHADAVREELRQRREALLEELETT